MPTDQANVELLKRRLAEAEATISNLSAALQSTQAPGENRHGPDDNDSPSTRRTRMLQAVRQINRDIIACAGSRQLIESFCRRLTEMAGYHNVRLILLKADSASTTATTTSGIADTYTGPEPHPQMESSPECLDDASLESRRLSICRPDTHYQVVSCTADHDDVMVLSHPVQYENNHYGRVFVDVPSRCAHDAEELALFCELAGDLGAALHTADTLAKLRESHRDLQRAQRLAQIGSWRIDLSTGLVDAPDETKEIYGMPGAEKPTIDLVGRVPLPQYREALDREMRNLVRHGTPYNIEFQIRRPDNGAIRHVHSIAEYDADQHRVTGTIQDITDLRHHQEALRQEHERMAFVIEGSRLGIWEWDARTDKTVFNRIYTEMLGYTPEELAPHTLDTWRTLVHPDDLPAAEAPLAACINDQQFDYECEYRMRHKDGHWVWILDRGRVMTRDDSGKGTKMFGTHTDITERKNAEKALLARERYLDTILQTAAEGFLVLDATGTFVDANQSYCDLSGYCREELLGLQIRDLEAFADPDETAGRMQRIMTHGSELFETTHRRKDGSTWPVEISCTWLREEGGRLICFCRDLSERRRADAQLRLQAMVLDQISDCVTITDLDGIISYVNDAELNALKLSREQTIGASVAIYGEDPRGGTTQQQIIEETLRHGHWHGEVINFTAAGREVIMHCRTQVVHDEAGRRIALCGISTDITEQKQAEDRLIASEERFRDVVTSIPGVVYQFTRQTDGVYDLPFLSQGIYKILECSPDTAITVERLSSYLHHDDAPLLFSAIDASAHTLQRWSHAFRIILDSGTCKWLRGISQPKLLPDGTVLWTGILLDITELKAAEDELRRRENLLQKIFEILPIGLWIADKNGRLLQGNPMGVQIWGAEPTVPISEYGLFKAWRLPDHEPLEANDWALAKTIAEGVTIVDELLEIEAFDGKRKTILNYTAPVRDADGSLEGALVVNLDISDRKALEAQLQQAQKMESVGRLAGGVAHDFNNMLGVILGYAELALLHAHNATSPIASALSEIQKAAQRSARLTSQLLAFARKQAITPKVIDLNQTVEGMLAMLRRLIGEHIELIWRPVDEMAAVCMDPSQIDQILANLCVNARDAITETGTVTIATTTVTISEGLPNTYEAIAAGNYVLLTVNDDGAGMDEQAISHLFEPFYTTKAAGKGTGLGLATVYGIVKQNSGFIDVLSQPGAGTSIRIYLPRRQPAVDHLPIPPAAEQIAAGTETVLIVEDEAMILKMTAEMLTSLGYQVLTATTPGEAISLAREQHETIHLLITDVIMPEMNGRELAANLLAGNPNLKLIFMSGYTADIIAHHGVLDEGVQFIQKPFTRTDLAEKIRSVLDFDQKQARP